MLIWITLCCPNCFTNLFVLKIFFTFLTLCCFVPVHGIDLSRDPKRVTNIPMILGHSIEKTNVIPELQKALQKYIFDHSNPIATIMIAEVSTGRILAMSSSDKKQPGSQGGKI